MAKCCTHIVANGMLKRKTIFPLIWYMIWCTVIIINGLKVTVIRHNFWQISAGNAKPNAQIAQLLRSTSNWYPVDAHAVGWISVRLTTKHYTCYVSSYSLEVPTDLMRSDNQNPAISIFIISLDSKTTRIDDELISLRLPKSCILIVSKCLKPKFKTFSPPPSQKNTKQNKKTFSIV